MQKIFPRIVIALSLSVSVSFAGDLMNLFLFGRNTAGYRSAERQTEENTRNLKYAIEELDDDLDEAIEEASDEIVQAVKKSKLPKHDASLFFNGILESFNERYPWELQGYAHAMVATARRYKMNLVKLNRILVEDAMMEGGTAYTEAETDAVLYQNLGELGFYSKNGKYYLDGELINMGNFSKKAKTTKIYQNPNSIDVRPKAEIKKLDSSKVQVTARINLPDGLYSFVEFCKYGGDCIRSEKAFKDSVLTDTFSYTSAGQYYIEVGVSGLLSGKGDVYGVCGKMAGPYMENRGAWGRLISYKSKSVNLK